MTALLAMKFLSFQVFSFFFHEEELKAGLYEAAYINTSVKLLAIDQLRSRAIILYYNVSAGTYFLGRRLRYSN